MQGSSTGVAGLASSMHHCTRQYVHVDMLWVRTTAAKKVCQTMTLDGQEMLLP